MKTLLPFIVIFLSFSLKAQPPGCSSTNDILGAAGQAGLYGEYVAGYFADAPSYFTSTVSATRRIESNLNYTSNNWGAIVPPAGGSAARCTGSGARSSAPAPGCFASAGFRP